VQVWNLPASHLLEKVARAGKVPAPGDETSIEAIRRVAIIRRGQMYSPPGSKPFLSPTGACMAIPLLLVSTALLVTQAPARLRDGAGGPRLSRGQELVYRGIYRESSAGNSVRCERSYLLESRVFVLDSSPRGLDVALLTVLRPKAPNSAPDLESAAVSVRLERALVNPLGHPEPAAGGSLSLPVAGPPSIECGAFVEMPTGRLGLAQDWQLHEPGRPPVTWHMAGIEPIDEFPCLRLEGMQQSPDWDRPRSDRDAWQRRETVWLSTDLGVARRVERILERHTRGQREAASTLVTYERQSATQYPGQLFEDRRREILEVQSLSTALAPCLTDPGRYGPEVYDGLLARIGQHLEGQPATPYREALLQVKRRIEAARRGETPPSPWP
jgi:hypothetical protein